MWWIICFYYMKLKEKYDKITNAEAKSSDISKSKEYLINNSNFAVRKLPMNLENSILFDK